MSKHRSLREGTVIPGSRVQLDNKGLPVIAEQTIKYRPGSPVTVQKKGQPVFIRPKPVAEALHFRNEAAKRRTVAHMAAQGIEGPADIRYAAPKDIVHVPIYRGVSARIANEFRSLYRRQQATKGRLAKLAQSLKEAATGPVDPAAGALAAS